MSLVSKYDMAFYLLILAPKFLFFDPLIIDSPQSMKMDVNVDMSYSKLFRL